MGYGIGGGLGGVNDNSFVLFLILILLILSVPRYGGGYHSTEE